MTPSAFDLIRARRFGPLCVSMVCVVLNDNLLRNAIVVLALFRLGYDGAGFPALAGAIFILPFIFFSAQAGKLVDRLDKARVLQTGLALEVLTMAVAALAFLWGSIPLLCATLFLAGTLSTICSTVKYGILPDHLATTELMAANGMIGALKIMAVLFGTLGGGSLVLLPNGSAIVAMVCLVIAMIGFAAALVVPTAPPSASSMGARGEMFGGTLDVIRQAMRLPTIRFSILGLSWFWGLGTGLLAVFPAIVKQTMLADGEVATLLLSVFAIGIGAGSIACAKLLGTEISSRHLALLNLAAALFCWDFSSACQAPHLTNVEAVLMSPAGWRILIDLLLLAACSGAFSVPLYAIIQADSPADRRAQMVAASNIVTSFFMVAAGIGVVALDRVGVSPPAMLGGCAALGLIVTFSITGIHRRDACKALAGFYFRAFHGVTIEGLDHYHRAGPRVVLVANHTSHIDAWLIISCLPDFPVVAAWYGLPRRGWRAKLLLAPLDVLFVGIDRPHGMKRMIAAVRDEGRKLLIFPEGRTTQTGTLERVYAGAGLVAEKAGAQIVAVGIEGLQFTGLGNLAPFLLRRRRAPLTVRFQPAFRLAPDLRLTPRQRRDEQGRVLHDALTEASFAARQSQRSLFAALLDARDLFGGASLICEDIERKPISYDRIVLGAAALGRHLARLSAPGEKIGVLLPTATGTLVTFMALQAFARVPAMLNITAGTSGILSACAAAEVRIVVTSRRFLARVPRLAAIVAEMAQTLRIVWLEDIAAGIGPTDKLRAWLDAKMPRRLPGAAVLPTAPGVVMFTSGSEGRPKGVVLSHGNIIANCAQLTTAIGVRPSDRVFNAMPMFHGFGLSGALLPVLHGVRVFQYPSPLHYRSIPGMLYDSQSTVCLGTDTFLRNWGKNAHPYDFSMIRILVSGGERVTEETQTLFADKLGVRILEGYGITEAAPVVAVNTLAFPRVGTMGRFLPGIDWRLEAVDGVHRGGRLFLRGPNVMLGYLTPEAPGILAPPPDGWFDTGDIVEVDEAGFVSITGRARRFAKIGGEMVSMAAAETLVNTVWPDDSHAVIAQPDPRKGESLLLVTTRKAADVGDLLTRARATGTPELFVPRKFLCVESMPQLASGKNDYLSIAALVADHFSESVSDS